MRIGAHLSISKGLTEGAELAKSLGGNTMAFFTRNPRGGKARVIGEDEIAAFKKARPQLDISPLVAHMPYTVNPAATTEGLQRFAREVVADDLRRMEAIGCEYLVIHPGFTGKEQTLDEAIAKVIGVLRDSLLPYDGPAWLLLETMAMPGKEVGGQFKDLHTIMEELGYPPRLGVCLDSCHLFSQGYALRERSGVDQLVKDLEEAVGMDRVKAVHLNDSKFPQGSAKDRHERIGLGTLGDEGIAQVINHPALCDLPFELETPVDDYQEYAVDIARVKSLRTDH